MSNEATETALETGGAGGFFPNTPAPDKPSPKPQAHRATITGVTTGTSKTKGTPFLSVAFRSLDTGLEDRLDIFPPAAYVANPQVDPNTISDEPTVKEDGTTGMSERAKYARNVRNSKGDGTIQELVGFATEQGHTTDLGAPTTFDEVGAYLNDVVTNTEVVVSLSADKDGAFTDRLRARRFSNIVTASNNKYYKNVQRMWESQ